MPRCIFETIMSEIFFLTSFQSKFVIEINLLGAGEVAQVVEHLPSKPKALSSNTSTARKNKK
jgi:hypothetical protein